MNQVKEIYLQDERLNDAIDAMAPAAWVAVMEDGDEVAICHPWEAKNAAEARQIFEQQEGIASNPSEDRPGQPVPAEYQASIDAYALAKGRNWRSALMNDWRTGKDANFPEHGHILRRIRNDPDFGRPIMRGDGIKPSHDIQEQIKGNQVSRPGQKG